MKKRVGIIGLGEIAQKVYLPILSAHEQVEIAGVMSTSPMTVKQIQEKYRIPFGTTKVDALFAQDLEAIFVHSPTETHFAIVKECLSHGIDVYVDKPLSYDWEESIKLAHLAEKKGILLAVGFNRRFAPLYREARQWMQAVGGFDWCAAMKHRVKQQKHSLKKTMYDDLIHILDLLQWLADESCEVSGYQQKVDDEGRMVHVSGNLAFSDRTGTYSMVRMAGVDSERLELHGGGRSVEVMNLETAFFYELGSMPRTRSFGSWDSLYIRRGFEGIIQHFLTSIDHPQECEIRADLVLRSHELIEHMSI